MNPVMPARTISQSLIRSELDYHMTNIHHGGRKALAEAIEQLSYRTLVVTDHNTPRAETC